MSVFFIYILFEIPIFKLYFILNTTITGDITLSKNFLFVLIYSLVMWGMNWTLTYEYSRKTGLTSYSINIQGLAAIISIIILILVVLGVWRTFRKLLASTVVIPNYVRLIKNRRIMLILVPLLFHYKECYVNTAKDGTEVIRTFQYGGGDLSSILFIISIISVMLYLLRTNLEEYYIKECASTST
jgi:hypothetical protein